MPAETPAPEQPAQDASNYPFTGPRPGECTASADGKHGDFACSRCGALAPSAQTQQGLSGELLRLMAAAYDTLHLDSCDHGDETSGCYACHAETIMWAEFRSLAFGSPDPHAKRDAQATIAALNPDKQPSPSAAPAQEVALAGLIDLTELAVQAALDGAACEFLRQTSNKQVCSEAIGAGEGRAAIFLDRLRAGKPAQDATRQALIRMLWREVADGSGCNCEVGAKAATPGVSWDRTLTDTCEAMRALGWGLHWDAKVFQRKAMEAESAPPGSKP